MKNIILYIYFSLVAITLNIFSQYLIFILYNNQYTIYIAMFVGTTLGLISKYIMDKIYIFEYNTKNLYDYTKNFASYICTGIFTTLIFWTFEYSFYILFESDSAKYIGAIIGLTIGYTLKYILDKKFVFKK